MYRTGGGGGNFGRSYTSNSPSNYGRSYSSQSYSQPRNGQIQHQSTSQSLMGSALTVASQIAPIVNAGVQVAQLVSEKRALKKAKRTEAERQREEQAYLNEARGIELERKRRADSDKERLQREESDRIRSKRMKGRRSLLSEDEIGVPNMRSTLG